MKISKREKIMLLVLGIIAIGILYYQFGYTNLVKIVEQKTAQKIEIEEKYNKAKKTIDSIEKQKSTEKILKAKINDEATPFYPTVSQEHIILEFDKLIKESGLEGGMTFEAIEVKGVESLKKSEKDKGLEESSLQDDADEYKFKYGESKEENETTISEDNDSASSNEADQNSTKPDENNSESINKTDESSTSSDNSNNSESTKDAKADEEGNTVTQIKFNVDFNGSYENVVKFLKAVGDYERKIPVYTINMSTKNLEEVKGSVNMVIYSVPKINDELSTYLKWDLNNTYGKAKPFNVDSGVGNGIKSDKDINDFMVSVKSIDSDLPTLMMGKADDELRTTYAYGDGNDEQNAEIVFTQVDDKYYYKYKTSNDKIPENYSDLGNEFIPNSENIVLNIMSESRSNSDDKSGLKLKIINNTNKLVMLDVSGDDANDPRVSIDGDSKKITINQK